MMSKGWHVIYLTLLLFLTAALFAPQNLKDKLLSNKENQQVSSLEEELPIEVSVQGVSKEINDIPDTYQGAPRVAIVFGVQQPRMLEIARHFQNKGWNVIAANSNRTAVVPMAIDGSILDPNAEVIPQTDTVEPNNLNTTTVQPAETSNLPVASVSATTNVSTVDTNDVSNNVSNNGNAAVAVPTMENATDAALPTATVPTPIVPALTTNDDNTAVNQETAPIIPAQVTVTPGEFITVQYRDNETIQEFYAAIHTALQKYGGKLDALILSDNDNSPFQLFEETDPYSFINEIDTNLINVINVIKELLPTLKENVGSKIIYVSSLGNKIGLPMGSLYNTARFAMSGFFESLYYEMQYLGIEVKTVALDSLSVDLEKNSLREQIATQYITNLIEYRPFTAKVIENIAKITNQDNDDQLANLTAQLTYKAAIDTSEKFRYFEGSDEFSIADKVAGLRNNQFKNKIGEQFGLTPPTESPIKINDIPPVAKQEENILLINNAPKVEEGTLEATAAEKNIAKIPVDTNKKTNVQISSDQTDTSVIATTTNTINSNSGVAAQATGQNVNSNQPNLPTPPTTSTTPSTQPTPQAANSSRQPIAKVPSPAAAPTTPDNSVTPTSRLAETPKP